MTPQSLKILKKMFGETAIADAEKIETDQPEFAKLLDEVAFERFWGREGLSFREKSIVTLSSQIALGRWDQVETHMRSFLHLGGTEKDLKNILFHLGLYCGFPVIVAGLRVLEEVKKKLSEKV